MSSLSRELVFLILQFLDEEKFKDTVHRYAVFVFVFRFCVRRFVFYGEQFLCVWTRDNNCFALFEFFCVHFSFFFFSKIGGCLYKLFSAERKYFINCFSAEREAVYVYCWFLIMYVLTGGFVYGVLVLRLFFVDV